MVFRKDPHQQVSFSSGDSLSDAQLQRVIWSARPSFFQFIHVYIFVAALLWLLWQVQLFFTPTPFYIVTQTDWVFLLLHAELRHWPIFVVALCYLLMGFLLLYALLKLTMTLFTRYMLMNDQLLVRRFIGVGFVEYRTEMYRVVDFMKTQMIPGVLFSFSTLVLRSTDAISPVIMLTGVKDPDHVLELLRTETERCRQQKKVQEFVSPQMTVGATPGRRFKG